jgi:exodeoxyribonuclease VII large subunit
MRQVEEAIDNVRIFKVSEITTQLKDLIECEFGTVWIVGEVSNCSVHSSGHTYFTLKDEAAQLRCILFSGTARRMTVRPQDGLKIYAQGRLTVYERQGQYELIVNMVLPVGKGDLYLAFGRLKEKLAKEGLFDESRKRPLPRFPGRIAVVTSPTGAAVRDVIRVAAGINAGVEIVVFPVRVQGEGAREELAEAIGYINQVGAFEVIILARGGGSIEDLWAFNEEIVARAIGASEIPVVSAVGHEIDFTISDFAADARAPTPSAAPPMVLAGYVDAAAELQALLSQANRRLSSRIEAYGAFLGNLRTHYGLRRMGDRLIEYMRDLDETMARANRSAQAKIDLGGVRLSSVDARLKALSPLSTLERGYSICLRRDTGQVVRSHTEIKPGDRLRIRFARGGAISSVEQTGEEIS